MTEQFQDIAEEENWDSEDWAMALAFSFAEEIRKKIPIAAQGRLSIDCDHAVTTAYLDDPGLSTIFVFEANGEDEFALKDEAGAYIGNDSTLADAVESAINMVNAWVAENLS